MHSLSKLINLALDRLRIACQPSMFAPGHFYSPIPDLREIKSREAAIWAPTKEMPSIDWSESGQLAFLQDVFPQYVGDIHFPMQRSPGDTAYFYRNNQFPMLDAEVLCCFLRHFQPARMIEIGSGFSSLVTAHVNRHHLKNQLRFTCVEPYPKQYLCDGVDGISELLIQKVQDIPLDYFDALKAGDVLFIDSSHVCKVGSDVNYLFFEIIPRLNKGVLVHIHDIFLPDEYPKEWVINEGRHWNEQYLVRAFLEFNNSFEILWAAHFMAKFHEAEVTRVFPRFPQLGGGGSLWLRRKE